MPDEILDPEEERRRRLLAMGRDVAPEEDVPLFAELRSKFDGSSARPYSGPAMPNRSPGEVGAGAAVGEDLNIVPADRAPNAPTQPRFAGEGEVLEWGRPRVMADLIKMAGMIRDRAQAGRPMTEQEIAEAKAAQSRARAASDFSNLQANKDTGTPEMRAAAQRAWADRQANPGLAQQEFGPGAAAFVPLEQANKDIEREIQAKQFERGAGIQEKGLQVPVQVAEAKGRGDLAVEGVRKDVAMGGQNTQKEIAAENAKVERERIAQGGKTSTEQEATKRYVAEVGANSEEAQDRREVAKFNKMYREAQAKSLTQKAAPKGLAAEAALKVRGVYGNDPDGPREAIKSALEAYARSQGIAQGSVVLKDAKAKGAPGIHQLAIALGDELVKSGLGLTPEEAQEWAKAQLMMLSGR